MNDQVGTEETSSFNWSSLINQTEADDLTRCDQIDSSVQSLFIVIYSLVCLVGFFLNAYIMKFYFCQAQQHESSSIMVYLKNLVVADFLLCLCLPLRIIKHVGNSTTIRQVYCNFGASALYLNMYVSILFMGYIAANRYLKIVHPLGTHILQTVRGAHILSVITWVCFSSLMIVYIILSFIKEKSLTSVPSTVNCEGLHSGQLTLLYTVMHSCCVAIFLFVLVFLLFFYYKTSRKVLLVQQRQPASSCSKKLAKSQRNMLVLVSVFCFCFLPYHLVRVLHTFLWSNCSWSKAVYYLKEVSIIMSVLNICLDPIIYFIYCKAFRTRFNHRMRTSLRREEGVMEQDGTATVSC